jgi:two-component system, OmpR family, response regulator
MYILLIEDDVEAASFLKKGLKECGHVIDFSSDGEHGVNQALINDYDVLIVDRMLPKRDGLSVIRMLRENENNIPVLILSALGEVDDRVDGLRAGGDDYLVKPCAFSELLARLESLTRRKNTSTIQTELKISDLVINLELHKVTRLNKEIRLQPKEYMLLEYLMRHAGQTVTRTMLLEKIWDFHFDPQTNVIDTQMSRLRSKINKGFETQLIQTIRGVGYQISESD